MATRQQLQQLFQFDLWSARKLTDTLLASSDFPEKAACFALLSHIVNVQKHWFQRGVIIDLEPVDTWHEYEPGSLKRKARESAQLWIDLIGDHEVDLSAMISHRSSSGEERFLPIEEVCRHLIVHGQHHRAQVALMLGKGGVKAPKVDFNHFSQAEGVRRFYS